MYGTQFRRLICGCFEAQVTPETDKRWKSQSPGRPSNCRARTLGKQAEGMGGKSVHGEVETAIEDVGINRKLQFYKTVKPSVTILYEIFT